ncbi:hypothetical protein PR048_002906 [Dryococelus australis]|uniref:Alpha 1,4-glycosyltransferase domain-containing protein n=1 Tax=Dryococelus australis TaxID=614101 RepID=A0ABQ9ILK3_9NEOP|nr:hypothetical protein PR048_002906 [Dryococelus australis]
MTAKLCGGMTVKLPETFFPFPFQLWEILFSEQVADFAMSLVLREGTYSVHAWNKMSSSTPIEIDSRQPYAQLAARFCRRVCFTVGARL